MFNKKNLNKFIASCISIATIAMPMGIIANASTYSRLIDNDPTSSSGNSSSNSGFSYISGGSCYNGDARIASSGNSSSFYHWIHPKISLGGVKTVTVNLQVYLNHANFTDPSAKYTVYKNGASLTVGYINQNTAAGGWNYKSASSNDFTGLWLVGVSPSGLSGYQTGADAVNVTYTY